MKNIQHAYIEYISKYAEENKIHIWLGGSFLNNTSTDFSDIDISVFCTHEELKKLIYEYNTPIFISYTSNPKGILIVIYKNGVALDLEIVKEIDVPDINFFHKDSIKKYNYFVEENICKKLAFSNDISYQMSRLFHRSLIKFLSGKKTTGINILNEITSFMNSNNVADEREFKSEFLNILNEFHNRFNIQTEYFNLLYKLATYLTNI